MQELSIDSVSYHFGQGSLLNGVFLNCRIGEIVGLMGRNGCGKSTLLKIIYGRITPHFMHLKIDGEITKKSYLSKKVGYLPQDFFIPKNVKIKRLVALFTNVYRSDLLTVEIVEASLNKKIGELSGGERRIIECLLLIYSDYPYVLLDEPFSQVSPIIIEEIKFHLLKFKAIKGFIVTDHYYRQILDISSRVVLLHNGSNYAINGIEDLKVHHYLPG